MKQPKYHIQTIFSNRSDGDMCQLPILRAYLNSRGIDPESAIRAEQVHGTAFARVTSSRRGHRLARVDGLLVKGIDILQPVALIVRVADCLPVLMYDQSHGVFAVFHAGWRGVLGNIGSIAFSEMTRLGAEKESLHIVIGPHIGACCYDIPEDRARNFQKKYHMSVVKKNGAYVLDLASALSEQFYQQGIHEFQVQTVTVCTSCSAHEYYSYRKRTLHAFGEQMGVLAVSRYTLAT